MFKDPVVEEVRAARQRHAARFNHDLDAIVADLRERQQHMDRPVVSLTPKRREHQELQASPNEVVLEFVKG